MTITQRLANAHIKGEIVADLPDKTDQRGNRFGLSELVFIKDFGNRPNLPFRGALNDRTKKEIAVLIARERGCNVEVERSQSQRCETIPATLAPKPDWPLLSGNRRPNSVATLGPDLSCRLPGITTCFRDTAEAERLVGPAGYIGVSIRPSSTASQPWLRPKLNMVACAISVFCACCHNAPAGWSSISNSPGSATAASVPSKGR
jgi:hypothetical protein